VSRGHRGWARRLTKASGPNFSVGFRFVPPRKRRGVYAAYAVCRVADDIVDEAPPGTSADDIRRQLDAWQAEIEAAYSGRPTAEATRALAECLAEFAIPKSAFFELIEGCRWDLERDRYATFSELERYCELVAVSISDISLAIFGAVREEGRALGRNLAMALQLTNICRDVGEDAGRGRIYLPLDELGRFGVDERALLERREPAGFRDLMRFQTGRAREFFRAANGLPDAVQRDARLGVRLMGLIYSRLLGRISRAPRVVLERRLLVGRAARLAVIAEGLLRRPYVREGS